MRWKWTRDCDWPGNAERCTKNSWVFFLLWTCNIIASWKTNKALLSFSWCTWTVALRERGWLAREERAKQFYKKHLEERKKNLEEQRQREERRRMGGRGEAQTEAQRRKSEFMHERNGDHCLVGEILFTKLIYASSEQLGHYRKKNIYSQKQNQMEFLYINSGVLGPQN